MLVAVAVLFPLTANATDVSRPFEDVLTTPDVHYVWGDVWGTWTAPDTYYVSGDVRVPPDSTLIIEPGVYVIFWAHYKFVVDDGAILYAVGTEADSIMFKERVTGTGWAGIRFMGADGLSQLSYCHITHGKAIGSGDDANGGAIFCSGSSPTISNNSIVGNSADGNGGAIYCTGSSPTISDNTIDSCLGRNGAGIYCDNSNPTIRNNSISGNSAGQDGAGIYCDNSSPTISANTISANSAYSEGGGICCQSYSSPTISNNSISGNSAGGDGGGIFCRDHSNPTITANSIDGNSVNRDGGGISCRDWSDPTISNNTISGNLARGAGGIFCYGRSSPTISNNSIYGNSAGSRGGGISCDGYSSPTISNNSIDSCSASGSGGGICCQYNSHPAISNNTVKRCSASDNGGGLYCSDNSNPTISNNTVNSCFASNGGGLYCRSYNDSITRNIITDNWATSNGGGIYLRSSNPAMLNNTFSGNSANSYGGGIYCYSSSPVVMNTILWADFAPEGPEIHPASGSAPVVTYSDVDGFWPGPGNIDCEPEFVNPGQGNYHLQMTSCCIDAGNPDSLYNDPDGTRNDIGAFYFRQEPPATIELMAHTNCIILPPEGGNLYYDAWVYNLTGSPIYVDTWVYAYVPGIGQYGPFHRYNNVRVRPWRSIGKNNLSKSVPAMAPAGEYSYVAYIGDFGSTIIDSSYFTFTKLGTPGGKDLSWLGRGDWFEVDEFAFERETVLPTDFALSQSYPNPFNVKTTINYQLPIANHVKLEVYNLLGQKLGTLVDEKQEAGYRSVIWDASDVSSGLYFYKLTAGDFSETRRMMLVK